MGAHGTDPWPGQLTEQQRRRAEELLAGRPLVLEDDAPTVTPAPLLNVVLAVAQPDVEGEARLVDIEGMLQPWAAAALLRQVADGLMPRWIARDGELTAETAAAWRRAAEDADVDRREALLEAGQAIDALARVRDVVAALDGATDPAALNVRRALLEALGEVGD